MSAPSIRSRLRNELTAEIKTAARRQLATEGANLSLRAVAREMGMVSSAVYRYFPSRDDLLTALIIDCYNELGAAVEKAVDRAPEPRRAIDRWLAFGHAVRDWALANPAEYALLYGSPVPGYKAPQDTVGPAARPTDLLLRLLADGARSGELNPKGSGGPSVMPATVAAELDRMRAAIPMEVPASLLARGITAWVQLFGLVNFELFGRFNGLIDEGRRDFFDYQLRVMGKHIGLD
jgi:AcrR family transcriptional regulator